MRDEGNHHPAGDEGNQVARDEGNHRRAGNEGNHKGLPLHTRWQPIIVGARFIAPALAALCYHS